jgi:hypothetical protein
MKEDGLWMKNRRGEDVGGWRVVEEMREGRLVGSWAGDFITEQCKRDDGGFCTCHFPHAGNCLQIVFSLQRPGVGQTMDNSGIETTRVVVRDSEDMNVFKTLYVHYEVLPTA